MFKHEISQSTNFVIDQETLGTAKGVLARECHTGGQLVSPAKDGEKN